MCGEFDEVSGIIDLVINFLAAGTLFLNSYDTLSYIFACHQKSLIEAFLGRELLPPNDNCRATYIARE